MHGTHRGLDFLKSHPHSNCFILKVFFRIGLFGSHLCTRDSLEISRSDDQGSPDSNVQHTVFLHLLQTELGLTFSAKWRLYREKRVVDGET